MKYKIAYIDESPQWINTFYQSFKSDFAITRIQVNSDTSISSLIDEIFSNEIDGVVTDYLLNEEGEVDFNGNKVIEAIKKL